MDYLDCRAAAAAAVVAPPYYSCTFASPIDSKLFDYYWPELL